MKKFSILAGVALLSLALSCEEGIIKYPGLDVDLNSTATVDGEKFVGLQNSQYVTSDSEGNLVCEKAVTAPIKESGPVGTTVKFREDLPIDLSDLPEAAKPVEGESLNCGIRITVNNPSADDMLIKGTIEADSKFAEIDPIDVPAGKKTDIGIFKETTGDLPVSSKPEVVTTLPEPVVGDLSVCPKKVVFKDITVSPKGAKTSLAAAESATYEVDAKYCFAFSYPAGTKLVIHQSFKDLNLNLDRINYPLNEYKLSLEVENSIPFDIKLSVKSEEGISGSTATAIKAGTPQNPVKTNVILNVVDTSGKNVSNIVNADLTVELVAVAGGSSLKKGQKITVNFDKLTIVKL